MTPTQIRAAIAADPALQALVPDSAALAAHPTFKDHREVQEYWLTDRGLVSDLVVATGSTAMSDAILAKLDVLAAQSRSIAAVINRLTNDVRGINWGDIPTRAQIEALTPSVFTEAERDAILDLANRPAPVSADEIEVAIRNSAGEIIV